MSLFLSPSLLLFYYIEIIKRKCNYQIMTNSEIINFSKSTLKGKYSQVILPYLIVSILISIPQNQEFVSIIVSKLRIPGIVLFLIWGFLINPALNVGLATFSLAIVRGKEINIRYLFKGFQFLSKSAAVGLLYLLIMLIGIVLFIIPGIIWALMFSQVFFILSENQDLDIKEIFKKSARIMKGNKLKLLGLLLRFFLFIILSVFTLFIWSLWLIPQLYVSYAKFYELIKD